MFLLGNQQYADAGTELTNSLLYGVMASTPANQTLSINATTNAKSLIVGDLTNLGAEKITNGAFTSDATGWTVGSGWAWGTSSVAKNANGTAALSQASSSMATPLVAGEWYTLTYTVSGWTVGTVTPSCGGVTLLTVGGNGTYVSQPFKAVSTADLAFTPSNTARFTIDTISLKKVQGGDLSVLGNLTSIGGSSPAADGTYNFDGSAAGTVASITIKSGIITGIITR
jgi:hypothetical protein